uniref:Ubiquitin-like protease family profile domain-containing protein n=1 Tax=Photinus pyralis TaxID=7054 RepID=A0A1Y1KKI8_PHOPY
MVDFINFIKNLILPFDSPRKRKVSNDDIYSPINAKLRRINSSTMAARSDGDGWHTPCNVSHRSSFRNSLHNRSSSNNSKENVTVIIDDDDDDVIQISKPKPANKFTSTPNLLVSSRSNLHMNGNGDDVTILKYTKPVDDKILKARKSGFEYIKPYSYLNDNSIKSHTKANSRSSFTSPILSSIRGIKSKIKMSRPAIRSSVLNQSFRLDEKMKYKQLLAENAPNYTSDLRESFSKYSTPVGKIFMHNQTKRNRQLVDLALNKNEPSKIIDLTAIGTNGTVRRSLSTKDTIKKVLDDFSTNEPITIKDSDSDIEILPRPPSPKPDIKVEPVNSIQKIIDTSEETHTDWLQRLVQRHKADVARLQQRVQNQITQTNKIAEVTSEINQQRLEDQMLRCLKIKEIVLPERFVEEAFPELSEEDECRIDHALKTKRTSPTEVLVQKFNLNITRADIQTLDGLNWLNDEVINFYMNLLIERGKIDKWPKVYAMNTFFYPKLLKDGHASLKRWTRRVDIFSYDIIAVPIHLGMHWCMSIINFENRTIQYYDSMGNPNNRCLHALRKYLKAEHLDKKGEEYDVNDWVLENVSDIPQQMNGSDCGVFSCTYAEFLTRKAGLNFSQENMPYLRRKMILEILNGELIIQ